MSGIVGMLTPYRSIPDEGILQRLTEQLKHRGPDGSGFWRTNGVAFGYRHLAIIDASDGSRQPMQSSDKRFVIVFNGELYNHEDLRQALKLRGCQFRTNTDTEVIMEAYRIHGRNCLPLFQGMYAFLLWDAEEQVCIAARDPFGKKPLYYRTIHDGSILFASELRPLIDVESVRVDESAIRTFLGLRYVPSPQTGILGIQRVPPGALMVVNDTGVRHAFRQIRNDRSSPMPFREAVSRLSSALHESVRLRMQADVTVGVLLSGGVNSAAILSYAHQLSGKNIRTFTMGFPYFGDDERASARRMAHLFGTSHVEAEIQPVSLPTFFERCSGTSSLLLADPAVLPSMLLARNVSQEVKAVLTGYGANELFGAHARLRAYSMARFASLFPSVLSCIVPFLRSVSSLMKRESRDPFMKLIQIMHGNAPHGYAKHFCREAFTRSDSEAMLTASFRERTDQADAEAFIQAIVSRGRGGIENIFSFDIHSYLTDSINLMLDWSAMQYGLEIRAPFQDDRLQALVLSLPIEQRITCWEDKVILRRTLEPLLPKDILRAPRVIHRMPIAEWFRGSLKAYWRDRCLDPRSPIFEYVQRSRIERLYEEHENGTDHGTKLWTLLTLSVWLDGLRNSGSKSLGS